MYGVDVGVILMVFQYPSPFVHETQLLYMQEQDMQIPSGFPLEI